MALLATTLRSASRSLMKAPSHVRQSLRRFSDRTDPTTCSCRNIPDTDTVIQGLLGRNLAALGENSTCRRVRNPFSANPPANCVLTARLEEMAFVVKLFPDVRDVGLSAKVSPEALHTRTDAERGNFTGDSGIQLAEFLQYCIEQNYIDDVGSILDIGGQNTLTIERVSKCFGKTDIPSMIVDINLVVPAVSQGLPNIHYVIDDAQDFFSSPDYAKHTKGTVNKKPTLCLLNNMLNVLEADKGWATLEAAWNRLQSGDYLVISGIDPEQFESYKNLKRSYENDGIVEFHDSGEFYKSTLLPTFAEHVHRRLTGASVLENEGFTSEIDGPQSNTIVPMAGRRLFTLKKE